jgi:Zn-dependent peptidase ImmA (M78 family)/transcriptional regulator with XRE-family HTH domain
VVSQVLIGERIRRLRHIAGIGQSDFAKLVDIASGSVSKLENGRMPLSPELLSRVASTLRCTPDFLSMPLELVPTTRPRLRAYADAPKRAVDQMVDDCTTAMEAIVGLKLKMMPDAMPLFTGDAMDTAAIEDFAVDVRVAAGLGDDEVVGNSIRAAERLGCIVLPTTDEIGRHLGLSVRADSQVAMICLGRWTVDGTAVPGDRQRFTVAHEIGHLALHSAVREPMTAEDAARIEKQANAFAGAFLVPGDALLDELGTLGGRVTLQTLARMKGHWGISIKALVVRFQNLGVIDADHARSLFKRPPILSGLLHRELALIEVTLTAGSTGPIGPNLNWQMSSAPPSPTIERNQGPRRMEPQRTLPYSANTGLCRPPTSLVPYGCFSSPSMEDRQ